MPPSHSKQPNARLQKLRKRADLSQRALGALAGVSGVTVHRIEQGDRYGDDRTLTALADALGVEPVEIGGPVVAQDGAA